MTSLRKPIDINIHDSHLGIWQDDANDPTFRSEIYGGLVRLLRDNGWKVGPDPDVRRNYRILSPDRRLASKGTLRAKIECSGRVVKIEFWATTWPISNRNGRRHDFEKLDRMTYLDRLRVELNFTRIIGWLGILAPIIIKRGNEKKLSALERIHKGYAESCHTDKELGRPVCTSSYNYKSADGDKIEHGASVWFVGKDGRWRKGTAYYNINNMWWVVSGKFERQNLSSCEIYCNQPANLRAKKNERKRRQKLEGLLSSAVRRMDYLAAERFRKILFGQQPTYLIFSRKWDAYYRSNCSGYTSDTVHAGKYTREEAEAEVRRVPHILEAYGSNGEKIRIEGAA